MKYQCQEPVSATDQLTEEGHGGGGGLGHHLLVAHAAAVGEGDLGNIVKITTKLTPLVSNK